MNSQAEQLNSAILSKNPAVLDMLSAKGKDIFFPKKGILAQTADANGKKIDATIGAAIEDDMTPMRLKPIAKIIRLDPKDVFPYASSFGKPELRQRWRELIYSKNPSLKAEISTPVATSALTHGLSMAGYLFADPGDKIILTDLFWGNYNLIFANGYGAVLDTFNTFRQNKLDTEAFREKLSLGQPGKRIILLNFPNNPTGYTPTEYEAREIISIIRESAEKGNKIAAIIDDAYFGLVYKKGIHDESIFSGLAELHPNVLAVKLDAATKEDYAWGLRMGFITFGIKSGDKELYSALENKAAGAIRGSISNASHLSQSILLNAYSNKSYSNEKLKKYRLLKARFKAVEKALKDKKYRQFFRALPYNSGYFMCVRLKEGIDAEKVRHILLEKHDTGVIAFGSILRIAYSAVKKELVPELFENIYNACQEAA